MFRSFVIVAILCCSLTTSFAASITVVPTGPGLFTIQGSDMTGVAGVQLQISYDTASFGNPSVSLGGLTSGALFAANSNTPGMIRLSIIQSAPFSGSGPLANIAFGSNKAAGKVTATVVSMVNSNGEPVSTNDGEDIIAATAGSDTSGITTTATTVTTTKSTATGSGSIPTVLGSVAMPIEWTPKHESTPVEQSKDNNPVPTVVNENSEPTVQPSAPPQPPPTDKPLPGESRAVQVPHTTVLERFHAYSGPRNSIAMSTLYSEAAIPGMTQEPFPTISNGTDEVNLTIDASLPDDPTPRFFLSNARLIAISVDNESGKWLLTVQPKAGNMPSSVTMIKGNATREFQITTVPPLTDSSLLQTPPESFYQDHGAKAPRFDLNGDGSHDYLDDYIYTGHFLIRIKSGANNLPAENGAPAGSNEKGRPIKSGGP